MISVALVLALTWFTGTRLLTLVGLDARDDRLGWFGWSVAAGSLASALLLFALFWARAGAIDETAAFVVSATLVVILGFAARARRRGKLPAEVEPSPAPSRPFQLAVVVAVAFSLLRILDGNLVPALAGDEAMLWGYRARVIVSEGGLGTDFVAAMASPGLRHEDYPLFGSLLQAWVLLGDPDSMVGLRLPLQLLALGLVTSLAAALRRHAEPLVGAALLLVFAALPHTRGALQSAGAEAPVALGILLAADGWLRFERDGRHAWLGLAALGVTLALFTKNDAALFVLVLGGAVLAARLFRARQGRAASRPRPVSLRTLASHAALPATVVLAQLAYNRWAGFENDLVTGKGSGEGMLARLVDQAGEYLPTTARFFGEQLLFHPRYDGLVFGLLILASLVLVVRSLRAPRARAPRDLPALALAGATLAGLAGLFLVYLATPQPLVWHLESSAPRVAWQLLPLACLALALLARPDSAGAGPPDQEARP